MAEADAELRNRACDNGPQDTSFRGFSPGRNEFKREVTIAAIKNKAGQLRSELMNQFDAQLSDLIDDVVGEFEKVEGTSNGTANGNGNYNPRKMRSAELPEKMFVCRKSLLTDLLEISHIQTIYHIFVAILIIFTLNTAVSDIAEHGQLKLDFDLLFWSFGNFSLVITIWLTMNMSSVLIYPVFSFWAHNRPRGIHKATLFDYVWLLLYVVYQTIFMVIPLKCIGDYNLPVVSSMIILAEQTRFLMKSHAFVRENISRAMSYKPKSDDDSDILEPCPDFSKYLYFLFVPTLVYRDSYPRTPTVSWSYVVKNFLNVIGCVFYIYFILERFIIPVFHNFNAEHVTLKAFLKSVFGCMMPGTLVLLIGFFAILHSWMNAFAEMLRFGDRMFYRDWWNSTSFANYYRTWNCVVHDWLYSYIYKDLCQVLKIKNRAGAMCFVFLLSAVFHEYILTVSLGFFYPVLFTMFAGLGFGFIFLTSKGVSRSWNVFMWVALFIGNGLILCLYSMEWYARKNCRVTADSFVDYLIPRSWFCDEYWGRSELVDTADVPTEN